MALRRPTASRDAKPASPDGGGGPSDMDPTELARFFGFSQDLLVILDDRGRMVHASPSSERLLRCAPESVLGRRLLGIVHPDDRRQVRTRARELVTMGSLANVECRMARADGTWIPMSWSFSAGGPTGRIYGIGRDLRAALRQREEARSREDAELRLRTARELHDGVLQTLTAAGLRLEMARRLMRSDVALADEVLSELKQSFMAEQRELRLYVDEMKNEEPVWADRRRTLVERVGEMLDRIGSIWGTHTSFSVELARDPSPAMERRILRIVQEATVNAARHGGARSVAVSLTGSEEGVDIELSDDGHGFPFQGDFDHDDLRERRLGPVSLKRRVADGGGRIHIRSTPEGALIRILLPMAEEAR